MNHTVNIQNIIDSALKDISHSAMIARSEDGESMYDSVMPKSRDTDTLYAYIDEALFVLRNRLQSVGVTWTQNNDTTGENKTLAISVPDLPTAMESAVSNAINVYISDYVVCKWMEYHLPSEMETRVKNMSIKMSNLLGFILTRKKMS